MASGKITLDSIIRNYQIEAGRMYKHNTQTLLQIAIRGMKDLNYDVSGEHTFLEVTNHNYSIPIPDDSLNIIGVFFQVDGLRIYIPRDKNLAISTGEACGVTTTSMNSSVDDFNNPNYQLNYGSSNESKHYRNGQFTGGMYGNVGGSRYSFWVNEQSGTIELSTNVPSSVVVEYLPTAKKVDGKFEVHPFLETPIMAYIRWRANIHRDAPSTQQYNQRQYVMAKEHLKKRMMSMTPTDFMNAIRRSYSAIDKF